MQVLAEGEEDKYNGKEGIQGAFISLAIKGLCS